MVREELDEFEEEEDMAGFDDPEDDGRALVSGAWGTGHDGSGIEIVGVEFVEVSRVALVVILLFTDYLFPFGSEAQRIRRAVLDVGTVLRGCPSMRNDELLFWDHRVHLRCGWQGGNDVAGTHGRFRIGACLMRQFWMLSMRSRRKKKNLSP